jgi:hypothetical protein
MLADLRHCKVVARFAHGRRLVSKNACQTWLCALSVFRQHFIQHGEEDDDGIQGLSVKPS